MYSLKWSLSFLILFRISYLFKCCSLLFLFLFFAWGEGDFAHVAMIFNIFFMLAHHLHVLGDLYWVYGVSGHQWIAAVCLKYIYFWTYKILICDTLCWHPWDDWSFQIENSHKIKQNMKELTLYRRPFSIFFLKMIANMILRASFELGTTIHSLHSFSHLVLTDPCNVGY